MSRVDSNFPSLTTYLGKFEVTLLTGQLESRFLLAGYPKNILVRCLVRRCRGLCKFICKFRVCNSGTINIPLSVINSTAREGAAKRTVKLQRSWPASTLAAPPLFILDTLFISPLMQSG